MINLGEYSDTGTHWVALYLQNNDVTYFNSFGVEHLPKEIKTFISNKNIKTNIFRIFQVLFFKFYILFLKYYIASLSLAYPISTGIIKMLLETTRNKN